MPRPVTWNPKSLFETTLQLIINRLANYNPNVQVTSSSNPVEEEKSVSKIAVNPFDDLPAHLLEKIINILRLRLYGPPTVYHRDLLVTARTKKLNFDLFNGKVKDDINASTLILELAVVRCEQLTSLHMFGVKLPTEYFCKFLPFLRDLQELDVLGCNEFNNCCLNIVGTYFRNLLKLNIRACRSITDDGIKGLCGGDERGKEMPLEKSGQCKSIQELSIQSTKVTQIGVRMALQHLKHLEKLDDLHVVQALAAMHSHQSNSVLPEYSLTSWNISFNAFHSSFVPYNIGDLPLAATLCPFITSLHIDCDVGIKDYDILGLKGLKNLNKMTIMGYTTPGETSITFDGGLVPVLKAAGSSLKSLELSHFRYQSVRVGCLVEYCPNLEYLLLDSCKYSLSTGEVSDEELADRANNGTKLDFVWNHLYLMILMRSYEVKEVAEVDIPYKSLLLALSSSPALKELMIHNCSTIDDELLQSVFGCHQFASLSMLSLNCCPAITMRGVQLFLNQGMDRGHIFIRDCNNIVN